MIVKKIFGRKLKEQKKIFKSSRKISLPKKCRERSRSKPFALMKQETSWESLKMPPLRNHHRRDPLSNECRLFFISLMSFFKKVRNMKGVDCNWHCHMSKKNVNITSLYITSSLLCPDEYFVNKEMQGMMQKRESCTNNVN